MSPPSKIKNSQLTRVGYSYQDLMCIRMLIDWFHDPTKYEWMSIEGNRDLGNVKSLDDVICFTTDEKYELYQVKFTVDSSRDDLRLDFDWLLHKKKKGTSLIQKWYSDIEKFGNSNEISIAKLITNRKPDPTLLDCLDGEKVNFSLIPKEIKSKVIEQLGDENKAIEFFKTLIFEHSQKEVGDLEIKLKDSLVPDHANNESWLQLLKTVEHWATHKNEPQPDGQIYLKHIDEILSMGTIRTISQYFEVPDGYIPPIGEFHEQILDTVTKPGCLVISGLPGMGKSTYLSYLTDQLIENEIPIIRHHYHLSTQFLGDRITFNNVAQSLLSQLNELYSLNFDKNNLDSLKLEENVSKAADMVSEAGKTLVVIIDGLDHVYRERSDISQLEHLINRLEPLKHKICLLFGTQPISDKYLPPSLLRMAPRDSSWIDIPAMGLNAIKSRMDYLVSNQDIDVVGREDYQQGEIVEISQALLEISHGYPLHIIYSLNRLQQTRQIISRYDVEKLSRCPDADINVYYDNLWASLSDSAREILLLIANADFSWPSKTHLSYCFENSLNFQTDFSDIQHLIEKRLSGITPFHNSLFVYLRNKEDFRQSKKRLNETSQVWLNNHAPDYWKWGWSWIIEANLGNTKLLINGITREWLIQSLCKGYPLENIEHIFDEAEHAAFNQKLYPDLLRLRTLKMRLINGTEFQIQNFSEFLDCAFKCSPDTLGLLWRADNLRTISDNEIVIVAKHLRGKNEKVVHACAKEIYRRIEFYARLDDPTLGNTLSDLIDGYFQVLINQDNPNFDLISEFFDRLRDKSSYFHKVVNLLLQSDHRYSLLNLSAFNISDDIHSSVTDKRVIAACIEDIELKYITPKINVSTSYIALLYMYLSGKDIQINTLKKLTSPSNYDKATSALFYAYFFNTLLSNLDNPKEIKVPKFTDPINIEEFLKNSWQTFQYAATKVASNLRRKKTIDISTLYSYFSILEKPDSFRFGHQLDSVLFNIRKALAKISIYLNILCNSHDSFPNFNKKHLSEISNNHWWSARVFFDFAAQNLILNFDKDMLSQVFTELYNVEHKRRDDTSLLANDSIELALLACDYNLFDIAEKFLKQSALNIIGYGHRKDITLNEVFEALEECSNANYHQMSDWLKRIATFTTDVFDFSEREIQHIPKWFITLLSKHSPERLVDEFDYHLSEQNWHQVHSILEIIIKSFSLSTKSEHAFLSCITTFEGLKTLKERASEDLKLKDIYEKQYHILGGMPPAPRERYTTEEEPINEQPDVTIIQPDNLDDLISTLDTISYRVRDQFITDWIKYWTKQEKGFEILNSFKKNYDSEGSNKNLDTYLHKIFQLSKQIEGKSKAYLWAVRDVKLNNCWSRYYHSHAEKSLKCYGSIYKNTWKNLLQDTMSPDSSNNIIVVPSSQLVAYLIAAKQTELAIEITEVIVSNLEGDIAHLALTDLYWYKTPVTLDDAPSHLIYLYYKYPDRYARLLTAKQIANLLQNGTDIKFRKLYLQYLSKQRYEVDIVDYLSILLLLEENPFSKEELIQNIYSPSLISNEILLSLGYIDIERVYLATLYSEFSDDLVPNRAMYDRYSNGLALRYIMVIDELEREFNIPLLRHFFLEWENIHEKYPCYIFNYHNFCSDHFYPRDKISCSFSWPAETSILSAYVRTLAYAIDKHSIPFESCMVHALDVMPFDPSLINILPSYSPASWPKLDSLNDNDPLPNLTDLKQYLSQISNSNEVVLRANGPILKNHTGISLDLRVILVSLQDTKINNIERIFHLIDHSKYKDNGIFPLAKWTQPQNFGRWEVDWLSRGYYRPTYSVGDLPINAITHNESSVEYISGTISNGEWKYWVDQWYPAHQRDIGNSLGTYFTVSKEFFTKFKEHTGRSYYLIGKMTCVDKRDFMTEKAPIVTYAMVSI